METKIFLFIQPDVVLDVLNKETLEAIKDVEEMKKNPSAYKSYTNVKEMMEDILD